MAPAEPFSRRGCQPRRGCAGSGSHWAIRRSRRVGHRRARVSRRPGHASGATTPAGAGRATSTRNATGSDGPTRGSLLTPKPRHVLRDLFAVAIVAAAGATAIVGYAVLRINQQGQRDEERPAGAIVVLGAAQYDGRPSGVFSARLDHAVALY